jgi:predicted RNase H-like HicB family nuclease
MQYQVFVKSQSDKHFTASVIEMPSIAVDGNTEAEAIANAKTALELQLAMGKIVTISLAEPPSISIESTTSSINLEAPNLEQSSPLVPDWQNFSESSLAEVWLNEEEDKAWQDL